MHIVYGWLLLLTSCLQLLPSMCKKCASQKAQLGWIFTDLIGVHVLRGMDTYQISKNVTASAELVLHNLQIALFVCCHAEAVC